MGWRVANSLVKLRDQVNAEYPNRSKISDGTIGNAAHAASASDHNPNAAGVVCALDITHSPQTGFDAHALADRLRKDRHPDVKYIISNKRIAGAWTGWDWVPYTGSNPHSSHIHVSVGRGYDGQSTGPYDDTNEWSVTRGVGPMNGRTLEEVAREVIEGKWGNGADRQAAFARFGYNYAEIQNRVNEILGAPSAPAKKSNEAVAAEVLKGYWGNGDDRKNKLSAAGYDYGTIQNIVNQTASVSAPTHKSNQAVAQEVLAGKYGNGDDRRNKLQAEGYDYNVVQAIVNGLIVAQARKSNETIANEVIQGAWGNGADRVNRLRAAGYDPATIQRIVNSRV